MSALQLVYRGALFSSLFAFLMECHRVGILTNKSMAVITTAVTAVAISATSAVGSAAVAAGSNGIIKLHVASEASR